jgi:hypothetical protein
VRFSAALKGLYQSAHADQYFALLYRQHDDYWRARAPPHSKHASFHFMPSFKGLTEDASSSAVLFLYITPIEVFSTQEWIDFYQNSYRLSFLDK